MARYNSSKKQDSQVQQVLNVLATYKAVHPNALIEAYRDKYDFISVRVIDPAFEGVYDLERETEINPLLERLPDEIYCDIMGLTLVTPEEAPHNGSSIEFDHPLPPCPSPTSMRSPVQRMGIKIAPLRRGMRCLLCRWNIARQKP